jgi:hypothetical protein
MGGGGVYQLLEHGVSADWGGRGLSAVRAWRGPPRGRRPRRASRTCRTLLETLSRARPRTRDLQARQVVITQSYVLLVSFDEIESLKMDHIRLDWLPGNYFKGSVSRDGLGLLAFNDRSRPKEEPRQGFWNFSSPQAYPEYIT